ncbi:hypothetical protein H0H92_009155, partial [Tricholoma furcatifolium]
ALSACTCSLVRLGFAAGGGAGCGRARRLRGAGVEEVPPPFEDRMEDAKRGKHTVPIDLKPQQPAFPLDNARPITPPNDVFDPPFSPPPPSTPGPPTSHPQSSSPQRRTPRRKIIQKPGGITIEYHSILDGTPCDMDGNDLADGDPPFPQEDPPADDYAPFSNRAHFEFAEFLYNEEQMSAAKINRLLHLLACMYPDEPPQNTRAHEIYSLIDDIKHGNVPWDSFSIKYNGKLPTEGPIPPWMTQEHEVWFQDPLQVLENQIRNPSFEGQFDYAPKRVFHEGKRQFRDLMSGNWAWSQCDILAEDEETHGAMFAPIILGSDKTTVSVATGQNDYYPLYASIGNVHNSVRRAHRNAISLIGFLSIPKTSKEYADNAEYRKFRRQLFHASLEQILSTLRPFMTKPRITRCADGHFRRVIYGLGPYIADYPEQALLACVVQNWCPKCTAPPGDLDGPIGGRRSHMHTARLLEGQTCTLKELWDSYGIVGDLI